MQPQSSLTPSSKDSNFPFHTIKTVCIYGIICLVSFIFFSKAYDSFKITKIEIQSENKNLKGIENIKKYNLLLTSTDFISKYLIERNPDVKSIQTTKHYPTTIELKVISEQPLAQFRTDTGYFILNENGKILSKRALPLQQLPIINYYQLLNYVSWQTGQIVGYRDVIVGLFFVKSLNDLNLPLESIDINGLNMLICNLRGKKILITTEKDLDKQEYELKTIVKQFKIEAKEFKVLDLRFDKPIITF